MRYVGVIRLSHATEETTSPERQRAEIIGWAERNDHEIIGWAEDIGVSATVSPWNRPSLGPWFDKPQEFDGFVAYRVDRIARRVLHFAALIDWCRENGKTLFSVNETFDLSTPLGRMFAHMIAMLAEGELEAIKERTASSRAHLRKIGRWPGGSAPYGYRPVHISKAEGWKLVIDDESRAILKEIITRVTNGKSILSIASDLNRRGVPSPRDHTEIRQGKPPKGREWQGITITRMLRSQAMLGYAEHKGKAVRDDDGMPMQRAEPLVTAAEWATLQASMDAASRPKTRTNGASPLLNIACCFDCDKVLHHHVMSGSPRTYRYYRCAGHYRLGTDCTATGIRADLLESEFKIWLLEKIGHLPHTTTHIERGEDHTAELAYVETQLKTMREDRLAGLFIGELGAEEFRSQYRRLEEKRATLATLPSVPDREIQVATGLTIAEYLEQLSPEGLRQYLINEKFRVLAKGGPGGAVISPQWPVGFEDRASKALRRVGIDAP